MKCQLVMLNNQNVIVSDENIKEGDLTLPPSNIIVRYGGQKYKGDEPLKCWRKVIAQSHQIDWNGLESEFGYVDVEKLIKSEYPVDEISFKRGFKKAQELNDKKFSLEDMREAFQLGQEQKHAEDWSYKHPQYRKIADVTFKQFIDSMSQPKVFNIEVEIESDMESLDSSKIVMRPKITDGKIKINKVFV